jgi:hypothetical protein
LFPKAFVLGHVIFTSLKNNSLDLKALRPGQEAGVAALSKLLAALRIQKHYISEQKRQLKISSLRPNRSGLS